MSGFIMADAERLIAFVMGGVYKGNTREIVACLRQACTVISAQENEIDKLRAELEEARK